MSSLLQSLFAPERKTEEDVLQQFSSFSPADFRQMRAQIDTLPKEQRHELRRQLRSVERATRQAWRKSEQLANRPGGRPEFQKEFKSLLRSQKSAEPSEPETSLVAKGLKLLDKPAQVGRALTFPGDGTFDWKAAENAGNWHQALQEAAAEGNKLADLAVAAKKGIGATLGVPIGALISAPGALVDVVRGKSSDEIAANVASTIGKTIGKVGEAGLETMVDPLMVVPVGRLTKLAGKGVLKGAQAVKPLRKVGQAAIGMGDVPLAKGLEMRATLKTLKRQARGAKDLELGQYLKSPAAAANLKTYEDVAKRVAEAETVASQKATRALKAEVVKRLGPLEKLPPQAIQKIESFYSPTTESFSAFLKAHGTPKLGKAMEFYEKGMGLLKNNVLSRSLPYHTVNIMNDSIQMFLGGLTNPILLPKAASLLRGSGSLATKMYGKIGADTFVQMMQKEGLLGGGSVRMGLLGHEARGELAGELAKRVGIKRPLAQRAHDVVTGAVITDKLPAFMLLNKKTGALWENVSKGAMFADGLKKGLSAEQAAKRTMDYLLDYRDAGKLEQIIRWFVPFVNWQMKAPVMAAKAITTRPGRVAAVERTFRSLGGPSQIPLTKERTEAGPAVPLTPRGEEVVSDVDKLFGGTGARSGQHYVRTRSPVPEALATPTALLQGETGPAFKQLGPLFQAGEAALGVHPLTGKPLRDKGLLTGLEFLAKNMLPGMIAPRHMQELYNYALSEFGGGPEAGMPVHPLQFRPPAPITPEHDRALSALRQLGVSVQQARPGEDVRRRLAEVMSALDALQKSPSYRRKPKEIR